MGRPKKSTPAPIEPEEESQEIPEEEPESDEEEATDEQSVNQADLVRKAVAAGHEKPKTGVPYIKQHFGADIDPKYYSVAKSQLKKREAKASFTPEPAKRGPKPKLVADLGHVTAPPKAAPVANGQADLLDALTAMKPLIAQYGADQVKKMVDLLG